MSILFLSLPIIGTNTLVHSQAKTNIAAMASSKKMLIDITSKLSSLLGVNSSFGIYCWL